MEKDPSKSVITPRVEFLTTTVTPGNGSPTSSTTMADTVIREEFCAFAATCPNKVKMTPKSILQIRRLAFINGLKGD
jgi:hypothetical protein